MPGRRPPVLVACRRLAGGGCEIVTANRRIFDPIGQSDTERWLYQMNLDTVFLAAGRVGEIYAYDTYKPILWPTTWGSR
jgi:hypothetical protein